jgi:hypothetical protein
MSATPARTPPARFLAVRRLSSSALRPRPRIRMRLAAAVLTGAVLGFVPAVALLALPPAGQGSGPALAALVPLSPTAAARRWKIRVTQEGLYRIGCDQLAGSLGAAALDLALLQLAHGSTGTEPVRAAALREVDADGDRRCDAGDGDAVEFWGEPGRGRYDAGGYYWLAVGATQGLRMALRPSVSAGLPDPPLWHTQLFAQNQYYRSTVGGQGPDGAPHDHWFWTFLAFGSGAFGPAREFPFSVPAGVGPGPAASAYVRVTLASLAGSHRVAVSLNGVGLGDLAWQGVDAYTGVLPVPPGVLQGGENRLSLALIAVQAPVAPVLVDDYAVTYRLPQPLQLAPATGPEGGPLVFRTAPGAWQLQFNSAGPVTLLDLSDPLLPVVVAPICAEGGCRWAIVGAQEGIYAAVPAGARLAVASIEEDVPSQWRTPANGADYILIAHRRLWGAAQRLADHRLRQGLRVALVDVQDIYDEFSGGQVDAEAIRSFLAYAYSYWEPPAPTYVLLLGDGTFDPRGYCAAPAACPELVTAPDSTLIPPYLAAVDPWLGETAADNRFVALDQGSRLPWLAIGRLPANDADEAGAMVDKILAYEANLPAGADARTIDIALVSDNAYAANGALDPAGNFWQGSDAALAFLRQAAAANGMQVAAQHFYLNGCAGVRHPQCLLPDPPFPPYADAAALTAALVGWLNARLRPNTTSLLLHYVGHGAITGWAGQPVLLGSGDTAGLGLAPHLPIVLDMSCYTGYFQFPGLQSMAEAWLSSSQHGAVAVIASSGLDLVEAHAVFDAALLSGFTGQATTTIGQAFLLAKLAAAAAGLSQDADTFHLFGDPAMPLWVARPAPMGPPPPTSTSAVPTSQAPATTPVPSPTLPLAPPIAQTLVPDPPAGSRFFLYLPWVPGEGGG